MNNENDNQNLNLTVKDAAKILGCSKAKIWIMIGNGELLAFKVGREYQISPYEIKRIQAEAFEKQRERVARRLAKRRSVEIKRLSKSSK